MLGCLERDEHGEDIHVFRTHQPSSKTLVVFIHGMGGQLAQFQEQLKAIQNIHHVLAMDLTGHGFSQQSRLGSAAYTREAFAALVFRLIAKEKQTKPSVEHVVLLCHSYGCQIGVCVANVYGQRLGVAKLLLLAPKAEFSAKEVQSLRGVASLPIWVLDILRWIDKYGGVNSISVSRMFSKTATLEMRERQLAFNLTTPTVVVKYTIMGMSQFGQRDFQALSVPFLVVSGTHDKVTPIAKNAALIAGWTGASAKCFVTIVSGHNLMIEHSHEVNRTVIDFINRE
ncbi:hypothetical protein HDU91_003444 [Kappamyces sp. JEL0680]|nr:hypothetical protein HDU91_003444 [Kappamyces sp. JEL0680]